MLGCFACGLGEGEMRRLERNDLQLFVEGLGIDGSQCEFSDAPDLLIRRDSKVIGIEHTRLYREEGGIPSGRQRQPQEKLHAQIVERALENYRRRRSTPLWLYVMFEKPFDCRKRDVDVLAARLAEAVDASLNEEGRARKTREPVWVREWEARRKGLPWPEGVREFHYSILDNPALELWAPSYGYAVPSISVALLNDVIHRKESRLAHYRTKCDESWLLIVTDAGTPASHFIVPTRVSCEAYMTKFERLYLFTLFHRNLVQLAKEPIA